MDWLGAPDLGELAGISRQKAHKALATAFQGQTWRGAALSVRTFRGRGGRAGFQYEVSLVSLPTELQTRFKERYGSEPASLRHGPEAQEEREFRYHVIAPALAHPKGSPQRGAAIRDIVGRDHRRAGKKPARISERTIQRWLDDYDTHGLGGLARAKRSDAGEKAVIISRRWDRAVTLDEAEKHRIARVLRDDIRGLHKAGTAPVKMAVFASETLQRLTREAGCDLFDLPAVCEVPANFIDAERVYRRVALFQRDRKAFEDQRPRVLRELSKEPMAVVYGDVHPIDIVMHREDGSTAHARAIGWLDDANRVGGVAVVTIPLSLYAELLSGNDPTALRIRRPGRSAIERDPEVASFLADCLKDHRFKKDILRLCEITFGPARTPSRASLNRYEQRLMFAEAERLKAS